MRIERRLVAFVLSVLLVSLLVPASVAQTPEPAQFVAFVNGDPGLPGDGIYVDRTSSFFSRSVFQLSTEIPLNGITDGFTATIFPAPSGLILIGIDIVTIPASSCGTIAGITAAPTGSLTINGVEGAYANITQASIVSAIENFNQLFGLSCTIDDYKILNLTVQDSPGTAISLDAAAIGLGSNNYPVIITPAEAIEALITVVENINLNRGIGNALDAKLRNAMDALTAENAGNRSDAINKLQAFINSVEAQSGKALTVEQATQLIDAATQVIAALQ